MDKQENSTLDNKLFITVPREYSMKNIDYPWIDNLIPIIEEYGEGEPLDGDGVDDLCVILRAKINYHQGNITEDEYESAVDDKDIYKPAPKVKEVINYTTSHTLAVSEPTGLVFDDYEVDSEHTLGSSRTHWSQVCGHCIKEYDLDEYYLTESPSDTSICGVKGCDNIATHNYDFILREYKRLNAYGY